MEGFGILWSCLRQAVGKQYATGILYLNFQIPIHRSQQEKHPFPYGVLFFLAEMEGFEPPHALRRLADFESAPFSHLGTSPKTLVLYQCLVEKSRFYRFFFTSSMTSFIFALMAL